MRGLVRFCRSLLSKGIVRPAYEPHPTMIERGLRALYEVLRNMTVGERDLLSVAFLDDRSMGASS